MDKAFKNYDAYSQKEEPRISHEEVRMGKIELLMQDNQNKKALNEINKYEKKEMEPRIRERLEAFVLAYKA